ncbi:response regulator [Sphingomonas bacterium]|uniref:response regulator n=1 Tax=Sphingomonas bacterium TaxID=1895847 RepID=UPI001575E6D4|nr:response regulator [Sphingomonas bacterium]
MSAGATILVVDDEPAIRRLLRTTLEATGYHVLAAATAAEALAELGRSPELVLLDLGLPDRNGLELLPIIAGRSRASVLVVSARDATDDKVTALDLGAVDYVTKPFDTSELLARIRAALRSRVTGDGGHAVVIAGEVTIDLIERRITRAGVEVHLTPKEYGVLAELARFPGRAITHRHLLRAVWPHDRDGHVEYLRLVVRNMRQKLETDPAAPRLIVNDMGVGYRLMEAAAQPG